MLPYITKDNAIKIAKQYGGASGGNSGIQLFNGVVDFKGKDYPETVEDGKIFDTNLPENIDDLLQSLNSGKPAILTLKIKNIPATGENPIDIVCSGFGYVMPMLSDEPTIGFTIQYGGSGIVMVVYVNMENPETHEWVKGWYIMG